MALVDAEHRLRREGNVRGNGDTRERNDGPILIEQHGAGLLIGFWVHVVYIRPMPCKPIELPPAVVRAFVTDMAMPLRCAHLPKIRPNLKKIKKRKSFALDLSADQRFLSRYNQRVPGSSPGATTTHPSRLYGLRSTRNTAAVSKTCGPIFLTCAVSAHELAAHNPIFAPCLRVENSRSRLRFRDEFDDCVVGSQFDIETRN